MEAAGAEVRPRVVTFPKKVGTNLCLPAFKIIGGGTIVAGFFGGLIYTYDVLELPLFIIGAVFLLVVAAILWIKLCRSETVEFINYSNPIAEACFGFWAKLTGNTSGPPAASNEPEPEDDVPQLEDDVPKAEDVEQGIVRSEGNPIEQVEKAEDGLRLRSKTIP